MALKDLCPSDFEEYQTRSTWWQKSSQNGQVYDST
jgi:hypothetical protein